MMTMIMTNNSIIDPNIKREPVKEVGNNTNTIIEVDQNNITEEVIKIHKMGIIRINNMVKITTINMITNSNTTMDSIMIKININNNNFLDLATWIQT